MHFPAFTWRGWLQSGSAYRGDRDAGSLKLENFLAMAANLSTHPLDLAANKFDIWHRKFIPQQCS
jgi:hypothetical protein